MSEESLTESARTRQQVSSRMMKTTRRGRPFTKDTHDLFATLIVSLELTTHRALFRTYPNSFTTDEAAENLAALKFSQSNRVPDPNEPNRVITTTTTTTFTMNRDMAKGICQHFMDARLIENAQDPSGTTFKDKGIYMLTPKGLHILERFITKNGINGEHLLKVFSSQPICMKLLHLERRMHDDELLINVMVIEVIFRRFVGRQPNYPSKMAMYGGTPHMPGLAEASGFRSNSAERGAGAGAGSPGSAGNARELPPHGGHGQPNGTDDHFDRTLGVEMMDVAERAKNGQLRVIKHAFSAVTALEWLVDYSTLAGRDEAGEVCAHFERLDLIELIADKPRSARDASKPDPSIVVVRGEDGNGMITEGEFRCHPKAIYGMTSRGREVARWEGYWRPPPEPAEVLAPRGAVGAAGASSPRPASSRSLADADARSLASQSLHGGAGTDGDSTRYGHGPSSDMGSRTDLHEHALGGVHKDSNTTRLRQILEEPALRSLFREFLKRNFCEENLSFWLDVQDFKRRFHTTSSATAVKPAADPRQKGASTPKLGGKLRAPGDSPSGLSAMERHQQDLIAMAFVIYNTYLSPGSPCELNIEHNLRTELVNYVQKVVADAAASTPGASPAASVVSLPLPHSAADLGLPLDAASGTKPAPSSSLEDRKQLAASRPRISMHASQVQTLVRMYQRIQDHIFRLMATDSVPRFIKDPRFLSLVRSVEEYSRALEAGRVDPRVNAGPAIGRDVLDAMDLGNLRDALPH